jgi:hypothetical protein
MKGDLVALDRRLHELTETLRAFAEATADYRHILRTVAERMAQLLKGGAIVFLLSDDQHTICAEALYFDDPRLLAAAPHLLPLDPAAVSDSSLIRRVVELGRGLILHDLAFDLLATQGSAEQRREASHWRIHSLIASPLAVRERVLGIVCLLRTGESSDPFDAEDEALARHLSQHAALAIGNAQLLEAQKQEIERRKRAEDQSMRFEALVEHSGDFIAMAALDGRVLFINQAGRRLVGIAADADIELLPLQVFHTDEGMKRAAIIRREGRYQGPGQLRHQLSGELIDTQVSSFLVRDALGQPFAFATVQHDMREMKSLEAQVRQTQRLEALGRLAGGIAHDFNNVLSVILGYSSMLLAELPAGTAASNDVQEIHTAGERAARLTRQLLAFSRQQVLEPRIVDLNAIVIGMESMTRRLLGEDVLLKLALSPTPGPVRVDVGQVEQILLNLALNARDAMPNGGLLTIATANVLASRKRGEGELLPAVTLTVSDTGLGMDEVTLQRAFEPFFTTKGSGKGTGLGLATVFGVVEQSGGRISISSRPGQGATFVIHLPRCDDPLPAPRISTRPAPVSAQASATILLVEDEAQVRKLIRSILSSAGYRVIEAAGPIDALRQSQEFKEEIALLVTDVVMPTMNGRELAELLKRTRQHTKVLYLSGYTEDAIAQHGVLEPALALLQKPVTPEALLQRIREVLEGS